MILALILAVAPPPPSQAYVEIRQAEVSKGYARILNCSGTGITCAVTTSSAEATITVNLSDAGSSSISIPNCAAGYVLDGDGGVLYCTNVIATATALAANPTDCGSNTYATAIDASGNLTCSSVSDTGLANAYSGVGVCGSHLWASTLTRNSAPTCTQPNYTDLAGCEPGQGVAGALQYNSSSCEGGVSNVISDGTNEIYISQSSLPSAPSVGSSTTFDKLETQVSSPMRLDGFMALPIPLGFMRTGGMSFIGTSANWYFCQNYMSQWNSTSMDTGIGCPSSVWSNEGATASGGGWAATSLATRLRHVNFNTTVSQSWVGGHRGNLLDGEWVGNAAGIGGFIMHARFLGNTHQTGDMTFVGVANNSSAFPAGSRPAQQPNSAYVGCDATDTNLQVCSNDGTTTSCTTTNASFPCRTNSTFYDVWIAMPPNAKLPDAGTGFVAYIERLDSAANITITKTGNMPTNNVQLSPHVDFSSSDAGGTNTTKIDIYDLETWSNL